MDLDSDSENITIGKRCFIGSNSSILPGTVLGDYCIVAANSVVRGSFKDGSIIGGIPSKILKKRDIKTITNETKRPVLPPHMHCINKFYK